MLGSRYELSTGIVVAVFEVAPDQFAMQAFEGYGVVEGAFEPGAWRVVDGRPVPAASPPDDLEALRREAESHVRAGAEGQRLRFVSPGSGKAMAYQQKAAEALAFAEAGEDADPDAYPHVAHEARALGIDPSAMAFLVLYLRGQWQEASSVIEEIERAHLVAIERASTPAEIADARSVDWAPIDAALAAYHSGA